MKRNTLLQFAFAGAVLLCSCSHSVTIEEIEADNIFQKLKFSSDSFTLEDVGLSQFQKWNYYTGHSPVGRMENQVFSVQDNNFDPRKFSLIVLTDRQTRVPFSFVVRNDYFNSITINDHIQQNPILDNPMPYGEEAIDYLLHEHGYVFKKTYLKSGLDLLIKKKDNGNFLVCRVSRTENEVPDTFYFEIFSPK